jgi:nitrite reductase (NO-forming)
MFTTARRRVLQALGLGGAASLAGCGATTPSATNEPDPGAQDSPARSKETVDTVAADPTDVPDPIDRSEPKHHDVTLEVKEVTAEIEPGVTFDYMTFDGQIPGPMIRVRQGDTVSVTLDNPDGNGMPHNVDLHAVYGTGGGAEATAATPGEENGMQFEATYPGAYIYHCAVANLDYHISAGMFGMILVEPEEGLPEVDREFYLGQHELYTDKPTGKEGHHGFDFQAMTAEEPSYVLLNGEKYAWAAANRGPMQAEVGETARVFMVDGGPNLESNFHPIGNVWTECYPNGSLSMEPHTHIQTQVVPPGSCMVGTMEFPVPERVKLVDHALSRVARKGLLAEIDVLGEENTDVFDPEVDGEDEGPMYGE